MQTDERSNRPSMKGAKLRYMGDELGDKPEYSGSDPSMQYTTMNQRTEMNEEQNNSNCCTANRKLRGDTGLIVKEAL